LYAHPDAFLKRWEIFPDGTKLINPVLDQAALERYGMIVQKNEGPSGLPEKEKDNRPYLIVSGQIPRETSYEKGFPLQYAEVEGKGLESTRQGYDRLCEIIGVLPWRWRTG
jgi:7,8-dihydropterin-6-yl-methyl-4-(beta-D-ribofuranosyl)aminobenzene 5'-phosphate synthase